MYPECLCMTFILTVSVFLLQLAPVLSILYCNANSTLLKYRTLAYIKNNLKEQNRQWFLIAYSHDFKTSSCCRVTESHATLAMS